MKEIQSMNSPRKFYYFFFSNYNPFNATQLSNKMRKSASMSSIMDGQAIYNNYRELSNLRQNHPLDRGLHLPIIKHRDPRALLHKNSLKAHLSTHALSHRDSLQSITPRRDRS